MAWQSLARLVPRKFKCGWCGNGVASAIGYGDSDTGHCLYICPNCENPTHFAGRDQMPGAPFGDEVANLPPDVEALYGEARDCAAASCYTASVLLCRKLLMNIAVSHDAPAGKSFVSYVEYLSEKGFVPPNGKGWVDHIRTKGNEATHEIALMGDSDAEDLLSFVGMLLKFVYEFPSRVPGKT